MKNDKVIMEAIQSFFNFYNEYIGTYLILILLVPVGIYYAFRLRFLHLTQFFHSLKIVLGKYDDPNETGDINHFRALATALSATVGTGNIVGVSLAIYYGGPGAIFWMWVTGFFGMMLKYSECTLSLKFRVINEDGKVSGGPMYYIEMGLKDKLGSLAKPMAIVFAIATVISSLGIGNMAQTNSISAALSTSYDIPNYASALIISGLIFAVIVGGIIRIAQVTSKLVPIMAVFYMASSILILIIHADKIIPAFGLIFHDAFTGTAATGGFLGTSFFLAMRFGVARGLFSNEAGQGSAPIAHAAAKTSYPVREGLVASLGPFIDTLVICTLTALTLIVTGAWKSGEIGISMTVIAFTNGLLPIGLNKLGTHIVSAGIFLFAISTVISWSYYGDRAVVYLVGLKGIKPYRIIYSIFAALGAVWGIKFVWSFTDMAVTFMTIPNLIALIILFPLVAKETREYLESKKSEVNR